MKRNLAFPFLLTLSFLLAPQALRAGGVVQEFRVASGDDGVGHSSRAMTTAQKGYPEMTTASQAKAAHPKKPAHCFFNVRFDSESQVTVLTWKPLYHNGLPAIRYHIYRWSLTDTKATMISVVDGNIFQYADTEHNPRETYFYKIVGIFRVDGLYVSRQYPVQQLKPTQPSVTVPSDTTQTPPPMGMGCSLAANASPAPLAGLLFLLLLFLPAFRRRT